VGSEPAAAARTVVIRVVLDTDVGTDIDDTWAIVQALRSPVLDVHLITTVAGDPVYRARIAASLLAAGGRDDVTVAAGIGGNGRPEQPQSRLAARAVDAEFPDAIDALVAACAEPGATIIAIGPLTNVAAALERDPTIASRARVVAMCGSVHVGHRGGPGPVAEYNAMTDVRATRAVLAAGWDVLLTPLDTCGTVVLKGDAYRRVLAAAPGDPLLGELLDTYGEWLDAIGRPELRDRRSSTLYDTVAVHLAHDESLWEIEEVPLTIDDDGVMQVDPALGSTVRAALRWRVGAQERFVDELVTTLLYC
jgi:inosine-uridine nucleoside N-ribohydrolase